MVWPEEAIYLSRYYVYYASVRKNIVLLVSAELKYAWIAVTSLIN